MGQRLGNAIAWQVGEILTPNKRPGIYLIHQNACFNNKQAQNRSKRVLPWFWRGNLASGCRRLPAACDLQDDRMICMRVFSNDSTKKHREGIYIEGFVGIQALHCQHHIGSVSVMSCRLLIICGCAQAFLGREMAAAGYGG